MVKKINKFEDWWKEYCKVSTLNREHLSFLDVSVLREEMQYAFEHTIPDGKTDLKWPSHNHQINSDRATNVPKKSDPYLMADASDIGV